MSAATAVLAPRPAGESEGCIFLRDRSVGSYNPNKAEALGEENKIRRKKGIKHTLSVRDGLGK